MKVSEDQMKELTEFLLTEKYIDSADKAECFVSCSGASFVARLLDDMTYVRPDEFLASLPVWVTED
jgi:hypothetical protein